MSALAAISAAAALAGCGKTTYFAGRNLPPSGLLNRVMIAVQNPGILSKGTLEIVDAYYDIRYGYTGHPASFSLSGFGGALPVSIQNMPEEQLGAVYGAGDGSFTLANYGTERTTGTVSGLGGPSSSIFISRNGQWVFAANQQAHVLSIVNQGGGSGSISLSLPGIYRVSVNPGGSVALAFVQNSDYVYYPRQLTVAQTKAYSGGPSTWPKAAVDCEPQNAPSWCLFQAQSPDQTDSTGNFYGAPLAFERPVKAVFSTDGSTAYIMNCGPECGGATASVSLLPTAPMIFTLGQPSGQLPTNAALAATCSATRTACTIPVPGGATNALIDSSTMYVVGQQRMPDGFWGGHLTVLNLTNDSAAAAPVSISDGTPGTLSRLVEGDDNTLWIGMIQCTEGERYNNNQPYGCLTMYNTSNRQVTLLEPYAGDATGVTAVTGLHKVYAAEGGQVYIYSTADGHAIDNQYVTVTGTAWDVAYMDAHSDADNTVY